jgi:hypothetical protein
MASTKTQAAPAVADEADRQRHRALAQDLLATAVAKKQSAYGPSTPPSPTWNLFQDLVADYDVDTRAQTLADAAKEQALTTWRQTPTYQAVVILETKIKEVQAALAQSQQTGTEAEDAYQRALCDADEAGALQARQQAQEAKNKLAFQGERLTRLEAELLEARAASQKERTQLLQQAAARLRAESRGQHEEALAKLGAALENYLPDTLLADEVEYCIRRWT